MSIRDISAIIAGQRLLAKKICESEYLHRHGLSNIDIAQSLNYVHGIRGAGKTTAVLHIVDRAGIDFAYIDMDDIKSAHRTSISPDAVIELLAAEYGHFNTAIIDEIVKYPEWGDLILRLLNLGIKVIAINSGAIPTNGISGNITKIHTLSFSEYCLWHGFEYDPDSPISCGLAKKRFEEYIRKGGFPADRKRKYLRHSSHAIIDKILDCDLTGSFRNSNIPEIKRLAEDMVSDTPLSIDYKDFVRRYSISSVNTLRKYVEILKLTDIISDLARLSLFDNVRNYREKVYAADPSLVNPKDRSARIDTAVYMQLLRAASRHGYVLHYYSNRELSCSFAICKDMRMKAIIQIAHTDTTDELLKNKLASLVALSQETGCDRLYILTDGHKCIIESKGLKVTALPTYDFLLDKSHFLQ